MLIKKIGSNRFAQTGTGKTAAFGLPMIHKIDVKKNIQGLVIAPTRELCVQISNDFKSFSKFIPEIQVATIYGGASMDKQSREIKAVLKLWWPHREG